MTNHERIKLAFSEVKAPKGFADSIIHKREHITETNIRSKNHKHIIKRALITAIAVTAFTTTALAATGTINFSSLFNSIFRNKEATPFVHTSDNISTIVSRTENSVSFAGGGTVGNAGRRNIDVQLLSAFYDTDYKGRVYLEFQLTDPSGNRLSDSFMFLQYDGNGGYMPLNINWFEPSDVQRINNNTVRIGTHFWQSIESDKISFDMIASNIEPVKTFITDFSLGENLDITEPVMLPGAEFIEITNIEHNSFFVRVTYQDSDPLKHGWGFGSLGLMNSRGEILSHRSSISDGLISGTTLEFNIGSANPDNYTIVWIGSRAEHIITGSWEFVIDKGDVNLKSKTFTGIYEGLQTEITVNALNVKVEIYNAQTFNKAKDITDRFWEQPLTLNMKDGKKMELLPGGSEGATDIIYITYYMDFINPEDVVCITFEGIEYKG